MASCRIVKTPRTKEEPNWDYFWFGEGGIESVRDDSMTNSYFHQFSRLPNSVLESSPFPVPKTQAKGKRGELSHTKNRAITRVVKQILILLVVALFSFGGSLVMDSPLPALAIAPAYLLYMGWRFDLGRFIPQSVLRIGQGPTPGIKGLLFFPAIVLTLAPIAIAFEVMGALIVLIAGVASGQLSIFGLGISMFLGTIFFLIASVDIFVSFFNMKRSAPEKILTFVIGRLLYSVFVLVWVFFISQDARLAQLRGMAPNLVMAIGSQGFSMVVWIVYWTFSRRVKITFVR